MIEKYEELNKLEEIAQKHYERLSKDIKELFTEKEYIQLVKEKLNQLRK